MSNFSIDATTLTTSALGKMPEPVTYTVHSEGDELTTVYVVTQLLHDFRTNPYNELLSVTINRIQEEN